MLCVGWSMREYIGIARWLEELTGVPAQYAGEDARAPGETDAAQSVRVAYWGLSDGQLLRSTSYRHTTRLAIQRRLSLTLAPGIAHTYSLIVGTTPVEITTTAETTQAEMFGLLTAAWETAGLNLADNGEPGGLTLVQIDNSTIDIVADPLLGGVPITDLGWGWTWIDDLLSEAVYDVGYDIIEHTFVATYWGHKRGRGIAKRMCSRVELAAGEPRSRDRLLRYTGQVATITVLTELDTLAFGEGAVANQDVAQLEITVSALRMHTVITTTLDGGLQIQLQALADTTGGVLTAEIDIANDEG